MVADADAHAKSDASPLTQNECNNNNNNNNNLSNNPIDIHGIDHVVLRVDDLEGMAGWYETVLGCRIAKRNEKFRMVHLDAGSALIDLVDRAGPLGGGETNGDSDNDNNGCCRTLDHVCLGLKEFDETAIRAHLASHGVDITQDIGVRYGSGGYGESLYFSDPEGTRIEIRKSLVVGRDGSDR
eukprot:CAMPEP_0201229254 /NCGR_PEP_ID=MMETSP0852-20130820/811_1 /ASSEMBLY_ACC=CAM_ASM_000632 /TAXON_ID=183588 /ORGANISM="Pseudo-nitzschia fraudulenta, Strain WWA7" /LENGTH=182 /DNA_ID=CAMNT_0047519507 /DNA_START=290 /DNA_END=838 /DNA_ORIENTATION=+